MRTHARSLIKTLAHQLGTENMILGAEIGVWRGELSADLLRTFPDLFLVMVDLWQPFDGSAMHGKDNDARAMLEAMEAAKQNTIFAQNRRRMLQDDSAKAAEPWPDRVFNFAFIDADHYYESVATDVYAWWPKVKIGGIAAGHDYDGMGDRRKGWGVKRAVDEFFGSIGVEVHVEPGHVWWTRKPE